MDEKYLALAESAFINERISFSMAYVDITGDHIAGLMLSQIMYWFTPSKDGKSKIRVVKKNGAWLAKSKTDWYNELRISPKQCDRALKILKNKGLIEKEIHRFNGSPTLHIRPKWEKYNELVEEWKIEKAKEYEATDAINTPITPKGNNPISPKGIMENTQREETITDTTTKITAETTNIINKEPFLQNGNVLSLDDAFPNVEDSAGKWQWQSEKSYIDYVEKILPKYSKTVACAYGKDKDNVYHFVLGMTTYYFKQYRIYSGKLHPWYKEETLQEVLYDVLSFFEDEGTNLGEIKEYIDIMFNHKSYRGKPLKVFASHKTLAWLKAELEGDYNEINPYYNEI